MILRGFLQGCATDSLVTLCWTRRLGDLMDLYGWSFGGHSKVKAASSTDLALHPEAPAHRPGQCLGNRQAQASTPVAAGSCTVAFKLNQGWLTRCAKNFSLSNPATGRFLKCLPRT